MQRVIKRSFLGASGVALADILANSVAVLLILIFLSISVKQEQAERQVEQTVDVSILMARQLADSIVLNSLPNSRPAYLHDYHSCVIQHDCEPELFPIIEIYNKYVRILHTNQVLDKNALLQTTNSLDEYLAALSPSQINGIRVDIYGIGMFYLAVSTLREYKAPLNHWHFLGEQSISPGTSGQSSESFLAELLEQGEKGLSTETNTSNTESSEELPGGIDLIDPSRFSALEESNLLLPPETISEQSSSNNAAEPQQEGGRGDLLGQLLNEFSRSRNQQELATSDSRSFQFRLPNVNPSNNSKPLELDLPEEELDQLMLTFIFVALEDAHENNKFDPNRLSMIFSQLLQNTERLRQHSYSQLITNIRSILDTIVSRDSNKVAVKFVQTTKEEPVSLIITPNSAVNSLKLQGFGLQANQQSVVDNDVNIDILMRLYPFVHRGDRVSITSDMMLIMHPSHFRLKNTDWYPIALVSKDLQQMTLGFVHGTFRSGHLSIPVDVNQVRAQKMLLQSTFLVSENRFSWQLVSAFVISVCILLILMTTIIIPHKQKKRASRDT